MSIIAIPSQFFDTLLDISRRHIVNDSIGDPSETWNVINANTPASVQNVKVTETRVFWQGKEYYVDRKAYIPSTIPKKPRNGDRVLDKETGRIYDVIGVEKYQASRKDITKGHHIKLYLMELNTPKS